MIFKDLPPVDENKQSPLAIAALELSEKLQEFFGDRSSLIFKDLIQFTDDHSAKKTSSSASDSQKSENSTSSSSPRSVLRTPTPELASTGDLVKEDKKTEEVEEEKSKKVKESTTVKDLVEASDDKTADTVDKKEGKKDSSSNTEEDDAYVKDSRKRRAAAKRTKSDMIKDLLYPAGRKDASLKEKAEDDSKKKTDKKSKTEKEFKPRAIKGMSDTLKSIKSILKPSAAAKPKSDSDKEDLSPDSGDDKTWMPPKKDAPGSSDDFKPDVKEKKKILKKKRSLSKVSAPETEPKEEKRRAHKRPRRPHVVKKDFAALGFELATPTHVLKERYLNWTEVLDIARDKEIEHGHMNSYFEPKGNEVYKLTNVMTRTEDASTFSHRDNYYTVNSGGSQKYQNMQRFKYTTKKVSDGTWSTEEFCKYVFTIPDESCILVQYVGDPSKAMQYTEALKPAPKKGKIILSEDEEPHTKEAPRTDMLDPSDYDVTDIGENEDEAGSDERSEEEITRDLEKKKEESYRRRLELQNSNLAKYLQSIKETPDWEPTQQVTHVPMHKKKEALEALFVDEDMAITSREMEQVINEAVRIGEGINDANETFISIPEGGKVYLFDCKKVQQPWTKMLLNDGYRYKMKDHTYMTHSPFDKSKYYGYQFNSDTKKMEPTATFKKYTYFNTQSGMLAIHYRGNVKDVSRVPHGNAKKSTHVFVPTSKGIGKL